MATFPSRRRVRRSHLRMMRSHLGMVRALRHLMAYMSRSFVFDCFVGVRFGFAHVRGLVFNISRCSLMPLCARAMLRALVE